MFGAGMPILFPIGAFAFFVLYYVERYTIARFYRQPPAYGMNISLQTAKHISEYSIILNFMIGFWMYSNQQFFANKVIPIEYQGQVVQHGHKILESIWNVNPGTPFLLFLVWHLLLRSTTCVNYMENKKQEMLFADNKQFDEC